MDVIMPQLGETVREGTVARWRKQIGETVDADEPLFDVETDKVTAEVPAPISGVLTQILIEEGVQVKVGTRLAVIAERASAASAAAQSQAGAASAASSATANKNGAGSPLGASSMCRASSATR